MISADRLKKLFRPIKIFLALFLFFIPCLIAYAAQEIPSERLVQGKPTLPTAVPAEKGKWYLGEFYEYGRVNQGSRFGNWNEMDERIGYEYKNIQLYTYAAQLKRFADKDYTYNFGTVVPFKNYYIHEEFGFGSDVDFIYKFQNILEVSHKLAGNLYWQGGYNYRNYKQNDTYLIYPGLIYYFGDNYVSVDYGVSMIESRGNSQFGTVKGAFAITDSLHWSLGAAVGERLYDIFELPSNKEYGYIVFTGFTLNLYKDLNLRLGYSYGMEKPSFIKRGLTFGLSIKF